MRSSCYVNSIVLAGLLAVLACHQAYSVELPPGSSHQPFDELLRTYVVDGRVDYPGIAADPRLAHYLKANVRALADRKEQLALWINAYNALAIQGILDGRSPSTLFGRIDYFKLAKYRVGGQEIDFYNLEHKLLLRPLGEPRIRFAMVCASRSCPKLRSEAYTADRLEQQLDENARVFINDPTRNLFDKKRKVAYLSMIFEWFEEDFTAHSSSVLRYIADYVIDPALAQRSRSSSGTCGDGMLSQAHYKGHRARGFCRIPACPAGDPRGLRSCGTDTLG
jgi:hypothetical protein